MKRFHVHVHVEDLARSVAFYSRLFAAEPTRLEGDYAKNLRRLGVPEALIELLGDCAAHDPDNRPKDAAELAERLQIAE